ncbi:transketolase [Candidatus Fermentibacteria bacterium]|nr:transketolase [Candidatus Fermentibacteria bacterium]
MKRTGFSAPSLPEETAGELEEFCRLVRGDIIRMTTLAGSGHPGGSMSSAEIFALLWSQANVDPADPGMQGRDRIIVSHGHTSPGVYAVLGRLGFFDLHAAVTTFRLAGSPFEGHVERCVPGVELTTGNLGQGVSAACGMAVSDRLAGYRNSVWVVTGDGEQQKGQISEARRFATAHGLYNLTVIVDMNGLQISGRTSSVMPQNLAAEYAADGWDVTEVDGHDLRALYEALKLRPGRTAPRAVLARTVMGKGVSFMENDEQYHGRAPTRDEASRALAELGVTDDIDALATERASGAVSIPDFQIRPACAMFDLVGAPRTYAPDYRGDNRSAFGAALMDLASLNPDNLPIVFDCDLKGSVKTAEFAKAYPDHFFQCGVMEHHAATAAGAASLGDRVVFWADFGVFAADETLNQHRLNDINMTNLKTVATHCGLDVGPDGKTHHCIKYLALMSCLHNNFTIVPADPNQTDRAIRYAAGHPGNFFIALGRSKAPVITTEDGEPFFGGDYRYVHGKPDVLRDGTDVVIVTMGSMCTKSLEARAILLESGVSASVIAVSAPLCITPTLPASLRRFRLIVTVEDHDLETGLGARLGIALAESGTGVPLLRIGVRGYGLSGEPEDLYRLQGLLPEQIASKIMAKLEAIGCS